MSKRSSLIILFILLVAVLAAVSILVMMNDPKAVPAGPDKAREAKVRKPEPPASSASRISPLSGQDHFRGPLNAPVEIIVYNDYACSYCAELDGNLRRIREQFPDRTVIASRHFPLRANSGSHEAALALECAAEQGKFWDLHDSVYDGIRQATGTAGLAQRLGGNIVDDAAAFSACIEEGKYADQIRASLDEAGEFGVIGTPGLFINGQAYAGALPLEDFVDSQGERREGLKTIINRIINNT